MTESTETMLECRHVSHWFGEKRVLHDVNLRVARGQIVALVGPSGCGKSTLLRAILGTHPPKAGEVVMDNRAYRQPSRDRGIVYQRYSLFPFMTARQNVAFGLMLDQSTLFGRWLKFWEWRETHQQHLEQAATLLCDLGLEHALRQYPQEMSGGMRQRVAIAQALIMQPKILLLDEPFGALDEATREELQLTLLRLYAENRAAQASGRPAPHTVLIVTHELNEAIYVSDRVVGLSQYYDGGQQGATIVYDQPAPVFQPGDPRDFLKFETQKEELRQAVFDEGHLQAHDQFVSFWKQTGSAPASSAPAGGSPE